MSYLISNIPYFKCWVRKEFTANHEKYHGEYLHAMAVAVNTIPDRCLSFQVIFTGCESDNSPDETYVHGGAMWARMPLTALVADRCYANTFSTTLGLFFKRSFVHCYRKNKFFSLALQNRWKVLYW